MFSCRSFAASCLRLSGLSHTFGEETVLSSLCILGTFVRINGPYMPECTSGLPVLFISLSACFYSGAIWFGLP